MCDRSSVPVMFGLVSGSLRKCLAVYGRPYGTLSKSSFCFIFSFNATFEGDLFVPLCIVVLHRLHHFLPLKLW